MKVTILATVMIMVGYFLILYSAVAFIQDKKFYSSAPKELQAVIPASRERFPGAHIIGWIIFTIAILLFIGAFVLGIWDGIKNTFSFLHFFIRFWIMLYVMEIYDIIFFDWILLCHSNFYPHFCPEVTGLVGPHLFGFNKKTHIMHFVIYLPICVILAWICSFL